MTVTHFVNFNKVCKTQKSTETTFLSLQVNDEKQKMIDKRIGFTF